MLTLQDIIKIREEEKKNLEILENNLADLNKKICNVLFKKGEKAIANLKKLNQQQKQEYKNLADIRTTLESQIEKQKLINLFIVEYVSNTKLALAYNYYIDELQRRPKILNKPLHYKVVKNALQEIRDNMPAEFMKISFYELDFQYKNRYKDYEDILTNNCIDQNKLVKLDIEINDPVTLANNEYNTYCQIFDILETAYKQVNILENKLAGTRIMQYNKNSISNTIIDAARCLPWNIYRMFNK